MTPPGARELKWEVHGLNLAGLAWGSSEKPPLLALHGWLDNAASFALLAPHLAEQFYVVALDLTGHGRSDCRSEDATYQVYDDLPQILGVVEQLGWQRFELLGHSRGAIISALFAASFPEYINHLVLLDGVAPPPLEEREFPAQMRNYVLEKKRLLRRRSKVYPDLETAVCLREEQGLNRRAAELIVQRNLRSCEGGYSWTTDPRLRGASAMKLTRGQIDAVLTALAMPSLLLVAGQGLAAANPHKFSALAGVIPEVQLETVPGNHHFHMEDGVATLGERIQRFLLDRG